MLPVALEPDHYLEHGSRPPSDETRVVLRAVDGDHQHDVAYLEPAQVVGGQMPELVVDLGAGIRGQGEDLGSIPT